MVLPIVTQLVADTDLPVPKSFFIPGYLNYQTEWKYTRTGKCWICFPNYPKTEAWSIYQNKQSLLVDILGKKKELEAKNLGLEVHRTGSEISLDFSLCINNLLKF